jgi:hypothetical protein
VFGLLCVVASLASADSTIDAVPAHGVIHIEPRHLDPEFWAAKADATRVALDRAAIDRMNATLQKLDATVHDVEALPDRLARDAVNAWLEPLSALPDTPLYDDHGREIARDTLLAIRANAALDAVTSESPVRFGLVTQRADLRTFPSAQRVFRSADDRDIDRFQESALFPGTPVAVLHESADRAWWFVLSPRYAAWIEAKHVAIGSRAQVFDYTRRKPFLVVTGPEVETAFTPERPVLSELKLDMGVRVPLFAAWPADQPVNGQHPYTAHVIELPQRGANGELEFVPALLPRHAQVASDYLPLTDAGVIRQGFKFLGERYGWGHSYGARDCSGFVSEVYRSFGIELPRNTRDQGVSEAFTRLPIDATTPHAQRLEVIRTLEVGDLIYIPGHVMMVLGRDAGLTYVIHDTTGFTWLDDGTLERVQLNQVAVTPLEPLMADATTPTIDRIYSIQRVRPRANPTSLPKKDDE